jgi:hypothetical protein
VEEASLTITARTSPACSRSLRPWAVTPTPCGPTRTEPQ